jgi:hypothetical protein
VKSFLKTKIILEPIFFSIKNTAIVIFLIIKIKILKIQVTIFNIDLRTKGTGQSNKIIVNEISIAIFDIHPYYIHFCIQFCK